MWGSRVNSRDSLKWIVSLTAVFWMSRNAPLWHPNNNSEGDYQMESLLTGYHSPSFLNVMQRRLTSRLYTFVLSLVRGRGVAQWWKQSSPVNVVCVHIPQLMPEWMPLVGQVCCWSSSLLKVIFLQVLIINFTTQLPLEKLPFQMLIAISIWNTPTLAKRF